MLTALATLSGVLLLFSASGMAQESKPLSAEVILDGLKPRAENPSKHKLLGVNFEGTASWKGYDAIKGTVSVTIGPEGRWKEVVKYRGFPQELSGDDGDKGWQHSSPHQARIRAKDFRLAARRDMAFLRGVPWRETYAKAESLGTTKIGDVICHHVRLLVSGQAEEGDEWWIGKTSHRVLRIRSRMRSPRGSPMWKVMDLSDWLVHEGFHYPASVSIGINGQTLLRKMTSVALIKGTRKSDFAIPKATLESLNNPSEKRQVTTEIAVVTTVEVHVASVRITCPAAQIGKQLARIFPSITQFLASTGTPSTGQPFTRYYAMKAGAIELEAGIPVAQPIQAKGEIKPRSLPAGKVAMTWHIGPYTRLGETHRRVEEWIKTHDLQSNGAPWEIYWTDPGLEPDNSKLQTQVFHPVKEK